MDYHSIQNQKILGDLVARDVIMNASLLVTDLQECGRFDYEDIQNYYYYHCPECGGEMREIFDTDNEQSHYYLCDDCQAEQTEEPEQEAWEVYEWWFVTGWLFKKLETQGEVVIDSPYGYLWGRCTTGQAILLDGVIGKIAEELEILEGQRFDWSKQ